MFPSRWPYLRQSGLLMTTYQEQVRSSFLFHSNPHTPFIASLAEVVVNARKRENHNIPLPPPIQAQWSCFFKVLQGMFSDHRSHNDVKWDTWVRSADLSRVLKVPYGTVGSQPGLIPMRAGVSAWSDLASDFIQSSLCFIQFCFCSRPKSIDKVISLKNHHLYNLFLSSTEFGSVIDPQEERKAATFQTDSVKSLLTRDL